VNVDDDENDWLADLKREEILRVKFYSVLNYLLSERISKNCFMK
jgi:hypothetical protein